MKRIIEGLTPKKLFELDRYDFEKISIKKDVVEDIIDFAKANYPSEFMAFLKGKFEQKTLFVEGLLYQVFEKSRTSAFTRINLPVGSGVIGSVHSHPRRSGPSGQDKSFFSRFGGVHIIISYPYKKEDLMLYDNDGEKIDFNMIS